MKNLLFLFLILFYSLSYARVNAAKSTLKAVAAEDVVRDYYRFLGDRNPLQIKDFGGPWSRRDVVELVLLQQVLQAGGFVGEVQFATTPTYSRALLELKNGSADMSANPVWGYDVDSDENLWLSESAIEEGKFVAGLYGRVDKIPELKKLSLAELRKQKVTTSFSWTSDREALLRAGFKNLEDGGNWERMVRMVKHDRVPLMLSAFHEDKDFGFDVDGIRLRPVPGYKILLKGKRVWAISKKNPGAQNAIVALQKGFRILKKRGVIDKAYRESGFYNSHVESWMELGAN
ncbi:hypothetical protein [Bdellovibrio sp. NC01]|uniref:hypothetical protein n=1 Tax=Bdellovibrio sp. NC01 TaxID=2220073 RepID=UPI001159EE0A|nr:hypothetical protein [Bdellovibrio sp. NC01]QDK37751.1 hypothetical protein DOE51_09235 [Bdellovibrio sp. NC01]